MITKGAQLNYTYYRHIDLSKMIQLHAGSAVVYTIPKCFAELSQPDGRTVGRDAGKRIGANPVN